MKIVLVDLGPAAGGDLLEALRDAGHVVRVASHASHESAPWDEFRPDAILALLESDAAACLDLVAAIAALPALRGAPVLVTGENEVALTAARRRFPDANFARLDAVLTALASIEAGE